MSLHERHGQLGEGDGVSFMQSCMSVATTFETWACQNVDFDELGECWPYHMHENFGKAYVQALPGIPLGNFQKLKCFVIADALKLPLHCRRKGGRVVG